MWKLWCKALGEKAAECDKEADKIALIRTFIFMTYLITNIAIVANAVRHWNDIPTERLPLQHQPIKEKHS
jgi:hypothetical protein